MKIFSMSRIKTLKAPPIICSRRQFQILLADDSHEISYLIFSKIGMDVAKFVVCCNRDWRFKV